MTPWQQAEMGLLKELWPALEVIEPVPYVRLREYALPAGWSEERVTILCKMANLPAEAPYGVWVSPELKLATGDLPTNCTQGVQLEGIDGTWAQFSWALGDPWSPPTTPGDPGGMVDFMRSIAYRFEELS